MEINKIYNEDCLEGMKRIADGSVDMVLCDPPYTMTKRGKSCRPNWMPNNMGDNVFQGEVPSVKLWMAECYRVLKYRTHFYTFVNTNDITEYLYIAKEVGFKLHNIISMIKDTKMPSRWYYKRTELVLFFRKGNAKPINDMKSPDFFHVDMPKKSNGKLHITQKPLDFIERLVTNSSKPNDLILDPFIGSGTTAIACMNTQRNFIGFEMDRGYYDIACKRIEDHKEETDGLSTEN